MSTQASVTRHVVGVMTGTSIDGIDAALVRITGRDLEMQAELVRHVSHPLRELADLLRRAADQIPMSAGESAQIAWKFGELHANVIGDVLDDHVRGPDLICVHGQTVFHQPPVSWQLINPAPIAARFACPVVSDLRQADLAAGGQGAPITPIADWVLFRDLRKTRAIVNLGGFCNATILPRHEPKSAMAELSQIKGSDVCACNQVLDLVAREALGKPFDVDGAAARSGHAAPQAAESLYQTLSGQRRGGRSLGTGDEGEQWVRSHVRSLSPADLAASAVDAIGRCIGERLRDSEVNQVIVAGGGARNAALIESIANKAKAPLHMSDECGVPIDARESMCFAILGALCYDDVPITLPQVTGCRRPAPVAGTWTGHAPIRAG